MPEPTRIQSAHKTLHAFWMHYAFSRTVCRQNAGMHRICIHNAPSSRMQMTKGIHMCRNASMQEKRVEKRSNAEQARRHQQLASPARTPSITSIICNRCLETSRIKNEHKHQKLTRVAVWRCFRLSHSDACLYACPVTFPAQASMRTVYFSARASTFSTQLPAPQTFPPSAWETDSHCHLPGQNELSQSL